MRKWTGGLALATLLAAGTWMGSAGMAASGNDIMGKWQSEENKSVLEMYPCGDGLCAKIISIADGQKTDDKNPDPKLRSRPIVGLVIMQGAKRTGPNGWSGRMYNRADGGTFAGTLTVIDMQTLKLQGCKAVIFCKSVTFKRVK
ncbi:MAG: DUF2147 domain-containing protein [Hyphomicrobiaceae bacterium]|nr:DUF2147 domain-containing protein [Hyphomicrobiaceae bacterium]